MASNHKSQIIDNNFHLEHNTKFIILINNSGSSEPNSNLKAETRLAESEFFHKLSANYLAPKF